jgi:ankyrin repeat protein
MLFLFLPFAVSATTVDDALIKAAVKGNTQEIQSLLDQGAQVNATNHLTGWTALTAAAYYGHPEAAEVLIRAGANPNVHDKNGGTPLMKAVTLGPAENRADTISRKVKVIKALLKAGADPEAKDQYGVRVWQMPMIDQLDEITQVFEDAGVKGVREERLIEAVDAGDVEKARTLFKTGVDVNVKNDDGISCWSEVMASGNQELVDLAIAAGADINGNFGKGLTPLMVAVARGNARQVRQFIDKGANINAKNAEGHTALDIATEKQDPEIIEMLKSAAVEFQ